MAADGQQGVTGVGPQKKGAAAPFFLPDTTARTARLRLGIALALSAVLHLVAGWWVRGTLDRPMRERLTVRLPAREVLAAKPVERPVPPAATETQPAVATPVPGKPRHRKDALPAGSRPPPVIPPAPRPVLRDTGITASLPTPPAPQSPPAAAGALMQSVRESIAGIDHDMRRQEGNLDPQRGVLRDPAPVVSDNVVARALERRFGKPVRIRSQRTVTSHDGMRTTRVETDNGPVCFREFPITIRAGAGPDPERMVSPAMTCD